MALNLFLSETVGSGSLHRRVGWSRHTIQSLSTADGSCIQCLESQESELAAPKMSHKSNHFDEPRSQLFLL